MVNISNCTASEPVSDPLNWLKSGYKVRLPEWSGYWKVVDGKIMAFCKDGSVVEATWTSSLLRDDWEIVFLPGELDD